MALSLNTVCNWVRHKSFLLMIASGGLFGCQDNSPTNNGNTPPFMISAQPIVPALPLVKPSEQTLTLWQSQQMQLDATQKQAHKLVKTIDALLATPSGANLTQSQDEWLKLVIATEKTVFSLKLGLLFETPAWVNIQRSYHNIILWPTHLGYLDNNGMHGPTGLVYDIDTPITPTSLAQQHTLTDNQDATLGLYPLGFMLMGGNGLRLFNEYEASPNLSEAEQVLGFSTPEERPQNRRRLLIKTQAQMLNDEIKNLLALWSGRDRTSTINEFSQFDAAAQQLYYQQAALELCSQQLLELKSASEQESWYSPSFSEWLRDLRNQRWLAQQQGLAEWLAFAAIPWAAEHSQDVQLLLSDQLSKPLSSPAPHLILDDDFVANGEEPETNTAETDIQLEAALSAMIVGLKQSIEKNPLNQTK